MAGPQTTGNSAEIALPSLSLSREKLGFIILKAREYDVKEGVSDPDSGSNPTDDGDADILEDNPGDFTGRELKDALLGLNADTRVELVALAWIGRGTYDPEEWDEALRTARTEHGQRTADYLLSLPLLGDYLADGLNAFGEGIVDDTDEREGLDAENEPLGNVPVTPQRRE